MASSRSHVHSIGGRASPAPPVRAINVFGSSSLPSFSHGNSKQQGLPRYVRRSLATVSVVVGFLVLSLLYYRPSSPHAYSRHIHHHDPHARPACDPYHSFGHLIVDPEVPENNRWHPFDKTCKTPELFRSFRDKLGRTSEAAKSKGWGGSKKEDVEWARGKTVLMIGDSTIREQLVQFCDHIGQQPVILPATGEPPSANGLSKRAGRDASHPRTCYSPELDFLLVSVFHFGVDEEDYWKDKDQYNPPGLFEARMKDLILPLTKRLDSLVPPSTDPSKPKRKIDLVEVSTGLWDLARFATSDVNAQRSTITDLTAEQLHWFRSRVQIMARTTLKAFPGVKVVWRSMHYPSDKNAKIDFFMGWNWDNDAAHRPFFHHNRILQLDHAARSAIIPQGPHMPGIPEIEFSEWGNMLIGQHAHQKDQLHPGPLPAGWLGSDMMLYELREAVLSRPQH